MIENLTFEIECSKVVHDSFFVGRFVVMRIVQIFCSYESFNFPVLCLLRSLLKGEDCQMMSLYLYGKFEMTPQRNEKMPIPDNVKRELNVRFGRFEFISLSLRPQIQLLL